MPSPSSVVLQHAMRRKGVAWCPDHLVIQGLTGEACGGLRADGVALRDFRKDVELIKGQRGGDFSFLLHVDVSKVLLGCKDIFFCMKGLVLVALEGPCARVTVVSKDELGGEAQSLIHNGVANLLSRVLGHKGVSIDEQWSTSILPHVAEGPHCDPLPLVYLILAEAAVLCCGHVCEDKATFARDMLAVDTTGRGFAHATSAMYLAERECSGEPSLQDYIEYHIGMCGMLKNWDGDVLAFLENGNPGMFLIQVYQNRRHAPVSRPVDNSKFGSLLIVLLQDDKSGKLIDARVAKCGESVGSMGYMRKVVRGRIVSDMLGVRKKQKRRRDRKRGAKKGRAKKDSEEEFAEMCVKTSQ